MTDAGSDTAIGRDGGESLVVRDDGTVDCSVSANWWRCSCGKANWSTSTCRNCGYSKLWGDNHVE